ncbi:CBO0543 family protein [Salipaludibacillus sp. HK11]|uniref:CBO0543 family protein n=1 Tax=Salipaludibacillus sp. HK11 TaxID=3394320 RepID=UPI0039FC9635
MKKVLEKDQVELYEEIHTLKQQLSQLEIDYWHLYSNYETWEFWLILLFFFIAPLVFLYFVIDRRNMLLLGFYGFNIHVWFGYFDTWGAGQGYWGYPFELVPFFSGNIPLETALIPVLFMLVYQWTLNNNKNYYVYTFGLTFILSFIFKPILTMHHFFEFHQGTNYFHLFLTYLVIFPFSKLITNIFFKMQEK